MSKKYLRAAALLMAVLMLCAAAAGCKKTETIYESYYSYYEDEGNDATPVEGTDSEATSGTQSSAGKTSKKTSTANKTSTAGKTSTPAAVTSQRELGNTAMGVSGMSKADFIASIPKDVKGKQVKIMLWWNVADTEQKVFDEFEAATGCDVKVDKVANWKVYYQKLSARIASNTAPTVACFNVQEYVQVMANNYFQPLDASKYYKADDESFDLGSMEYAKKDGKYYGIAHKNGDQIHMYIVMFNKKMFSDYGIQSPYQLWKAGNWNWDTFVSCMTEAVNANKAANPTLGGFEAWNQWCWPASCGADFVTKNGDKVSYGITDDLVKGYQFYWDCANTWKITPTSTPSSEDDLKAGKYVAWVGASYMAQKARNKETGAGEKWGFAPMPNPKGQENIAVMAGNTWGFPQKAKNVDAGYFFMMFWLNNNYYPEAMYINDEFYEVYQWMANLPKKTTCISEAIYEYGGEGNFAGLTGTVESAGAGELQATLDAGKGLFESNLKKLQNIW